MYERIVRRKVCFWWRQGRENVCKAKGRKEERVCEAKRRKRLSTSQKEGRARQRVALFKPFHHNFSLPFQVVLIKKILWKAQALVRSSEATWLLLADAAWLMELTTAWLMEPCRSINLWLCVIKMADRHIFVSLVKVCPWNGFLAYYSLTKTLCLACDISFIHVNGLGWAMISLIWLSFFLLPLVN